MSDPQGFNIYNVKNAGRNCRYASPLPLDLVQQYGLVAEAIIGEVVSDDDGDPAREFKTNPAFVRFLQWSIAQHVSDCDAVKKQALKIENGNVLVPDFRKPDADGTIAPEEVIGLVEVKDGQIVRFHGSPDYCPLTEKGFMKLDEFFLDHYQADLLAYIEKSAQA